jgi:hypothetical protein
LLVALGGLIAASMVALLIVVTPLILQTTPDATTRFTGGVQGGILVFSIFYTLLVFGLIAMGGGLIQVGYGKRSQGIGYLLRVVLLTLFILGMMMGFLE